MGYKFTLGPTVHTTLAVLRSYLELDWFPRRLGPLSLGVKAKLELKSSISIGAINEISPKGFTLRVSLKNKTIFLIYHFMALT